MIAQIVDYVNTTLRAGGLSADRFANASINGIAFSQLRDNGQGQYDALPVLLKDGRLQDVAVTDLHEITLWHKNQGSIPAPNKQQYGDANNILVRSVQMAMLVVCNLVRMKMNAEDIDLLIIDSFPSQLPKTMINSLKISTCVITLQGTNFNSAELYLREFRTSEYKLKPHHQMLEVRYKIECTFRQGCINTCNDC